MVRQVIVHLAHLADEYFASEDWGDLVAAKRLSWSLISDLRLIVEAATGVQIISVSSVALDVVAVIGEGCSSFPSFCDCHVKLEVRPGMIS